MAPSLGLECYLARAVFRSRFFRESSGFASDSRVARNGQK
jgi:hypothetical protein